MPHLPSDVERASSGHGCGVLGLVAQAPRTSRRVGSREAAASGRTVVAHLCVHARASVVRVVIWVLKKKRSQPGVQWVRYFPRTQTRDQLRVGQFALAQRVSPRERRAGSQNLRFAPNVGRGPALPHRRRAHLSGRPTTAISSSHHHPGRPLHSSGSPGIRAPTSRRRRRARRHSRRRTDAGRRRRCRTGVANIRLRSRFQVGPPGVSTLGGLEALSAEFIANTPNGGVRGVAAFVEGSGRVFRHRAGAERSDARGVHGAFRIGGADRAAGNHQPPSRRVGSPERRDAGEASRVVITPPAARR